jgi:cobalt-precorrin-5B (C1)-methyltransferase
MMTEICEEICAKYGLPADLVITISVPDGEEIAKKTWNPRLGIVGGISILGTTGVVHPFSCSAWIHSIHRGIDVARAAGQKHVLGATGSTSEDAAQAIYDLPDFAILDMGDFAGGVLKYLRDHPIDKLTIAGGFAKLTKLAQGALDLHSARSQVDMGFLAEIAEQAGAPGNLKDRILFANTAKEVLDMTQAIGIDIATPIAVKAKETALATLRGAPVDVEIIMTDRVGTILARV